MVLCPSMSLPRFVGTPDYVMNTPLFQHTAITRGDAHDDPFHIIAMGAGQDRPHSRHVFLNSQEVRGALLSDRDIAPGGILQFVLEPAAGSEPMSQDSNKEIKIFTTEDLRPRPVSEVHSVRQEGGRGEDHQDQGLLVQQKAQIEELQHRLREVSAEGGGALQHQHHSAMEPVVQHHVSEDGSLIVAADCGSTVHIGLVVLCVNLVILCSMLVMQLQKYRASNTVSSSADEGDIISCIAYSLHCHVD